jgi:hypothetical protein
MAHQFRKHYTREQARALLPEVRQWLESLARSRKHIARLDLRLSQSFARGCDVGGDLANEWIRVFCTMKKQLREFHQREIQVKDLDRGIVDFPALMGGREVFLCWEKDEDDIEFWHDLDSGYAGRERLT